MGAGCGARERRVVEREESKRGEVREKERDAMAGRMPRTKNGEERSSGGRERRRKKESAAGLLE